MGNHPAGGHGHAGHGHADHGHGHAGHGHGHADHGHGHADHCASACGDGSERRFIALFGAIFLGVACFGLGHRQGRHADPPRDTAVAADDHVAFVPGGLAGTVVEVGLPSGRPIGSMPVFEPRPGVGYAGTGSPTLKRLLETGNASGDVVAVEPSRTDKGAPDGKSLFAVDKAHNRVARIDLKTRAVEQIAHVPGILGASDCEHVPALGLVAVTGEFRGPDGGHVAFLDAVTLGTKFLVQLPSDAARCAASRDGKWLFVTSYNTERATTPRGMRESPDDAVYVLDIAACAEAAKSSEGVSVVRAVDSTRTPLLAHVLSVPTGALEIAITADGRYAVVSCPWSESAVVIEVSKVGDKNPRDAILAEPRIGVGAVACAIGKDGQAYSVLFETGELVQWDLAAAIAGRSHVTRRIGLGLAPSGVALAISATSGVVEQVVAISATRARTYAPVAGKLHTGNTFALEQPASMAAVIPAARLALREDKGPVDGPKGADGKEFVAGTSRDEDSLSVRVALSRGSIVPESVKARAGEEVTFTVANLDRVPGMDQALVVSGHGVAILVPPGQTRTVRFKAAGPGTFWFYAARPTALGTPETRGRLIVEPK